MRRAGAWLAAALGALGGLPVLASLASEIYLGAARFMTLAQELAAAFWSALRLVASLLILLLIQLAAFLELMALAASGALSAMLRFGSLRAASPSAGQP